MIDDNKIKYWTIYIEDDLEIARRIKKLREEEKQKNSISINLKPKDDIVVDDVEFDYIKPETVGINDLIKSSPNKEYIERIKNNESDVSYTLPDNS